MPSPEKGKAKKKPGKKGGKKATQAKVTGKRQQSNRDSKVSRNCGKCGHKAADCRYKPDEQIKVEARAQGSRNPR